MNAHRRLAFLYTVLTAILTSGSFAHAAQEATNTQGQGLAVAEFNKEEGFKISDSGLTTMGIEFTAIPAGKSSFLVPQDAIVRVKHSTGVYRRFEGWISLVLVKIVGRENGSYRITSEDLEAGDEIATRGTQFLRMTELDLNSDTVDTCSH